MPAVKSRSSMPSANLFCRGSEPAMGQGCPAPASPPRQVASAKADSSQSVSVTFKKARENSTFSQR